MPRPLNINHEDILRYDEIIDNDLFLDKNLSQQPIIREICYAGQYLSEKLIELNCQPNIIGQIIYTAGTLCFGCSDPWIVHLDILDKYISGTLAFEKDISNEFN